MRDRIILKKLTQNKIVLKIQSSIKYDMTLSRCHGKEQTNIVRYFCLDSKVLIMSNLAIFSFDYK